jgi:hypothetical protein
MGALRTTLRTALPPSVRTWIHFLRSPGSRAAITRMRADERMLRLATSASDGLWKAVGGKVATGPFRGMHYIRESVGSAWAPKVLGTYEKELWPIFEAIVAERYDSFVDIGAAEGFYAVGLAMCMPRLRVIAFEAQTDTHRWLGSLSVANGVEERIKIFGACSSESLATACRKSGKTLVLCDAEGAEYALLQPSNFPDSASTSFLVELHHWVYPDIENVLRDRFSQTHTVEIICASPRTAADWPGEVRIAERYHLACMNEARPPGMKWMWLRCRALGRDA